jgi:hypothetical protein
MTRLQAFLTWCPYYINTEETALARASSLSILTVGIFISRTGDSSRSSGAIDHLHPRRRGLYCAGALPAKLSEGVNDKSTVVLARDPVSSG